MAFNSTSPTLRLVFKESGLATTVALFALVTNFLFASGHNLQRCVEIIALCMIASVLLFRAVKGNIPAIPKSAGALLLSFLMLGLASSATAYSLRHAVNEWSNIALLLALVFATSAELAKDSGRLHRLIQWVGIACLLYSLRLIIMYAVSLQIGFQIDMHTLAVGFSNIRFLNHTQTALLPFIVLLCLQAPRAGWWRKTWFLLAAFWWALLLVSEARATILALLIGSVIVVALRRSHARQFIVMLAWTLIAGIFMYATLFILLPLALGLQPIGMLSNAVARTVANPSSDRNHLWSLAGHLIQAHPWLGVGPQHFAHEGARLYAGAHPHDWLLQFAAEWGVPALLCLLGTVGIGTRALVRSGARIASGDLVNQQMLLALLLACSAIFVDGLFSGVLVMPQSRLTIALVLGMACAWVRLQNATEQQIAPAPSFVQRVIFMALLTTGLCGLIWSVAPDFVRYARGEAATPAEQAVNPGTQWPRMWSPGFF